MQTWGVEIGVAGLPLRPDGTIYRVVAAEDNTAVTLDGSPLTTLVNSGDVFETGSLVGNHAFRADKPIFVTQFMTGISSPGAILGDPAMGNMVPFAQYLNAYTFSTVGGSQFARNFVTIIAAQQDVDMGMVLLDGAVIPAGDFTPVPTTSFAAAIIELVEGVHSTSSPNSHGITVEGYNEFDSYIYPGGALFNFINPGEDDNPPIITLLPQTGVPPVVNGVATDNQELDSGIFFLVLEDGATNLILTPEEFVPGEEEVSFVVSLVDPMMDGTGTIVATDGSGNTASVVVAISVEGGDNGGKKSSSKSKASKASKKSSKKLGGHQKFTTTGTTMNVLHDDT